MKSLYAIRDELTNKYIHTNRSGIILIDDPITLYCKEDAEDILERCEGFKSMRPKLISFDELVEECRAENEYGAYGGM